MTGTVPSRPAAGEGAQRIRTAFREAVASGEPLIIPGCPDAVSARMAEEIGFRVVYVSGAGTTNSRYGIPDLSFLSLADVERQVLDLASAVSVPILADVDTGFGNAVNAYWTAKRLATVGASGIQIEDQVLPKKCGHFDDKKVTTAAEMVGKIAAVREAVSDDLVVVARTDSIAVHGLADAISRVNTYLDVGADVGFIEAPEATADVRKLPEAVNGPLLLNIVEGGRTTNVSLREARDWGYAGLLYANTALRASWSAMRGALEFLAAHGESPGTGEGPVLSWEERQRLVGLEYYLQIGNRLIPKDA